MSTFRPEFERALALVAEASDVVAKGGYPRPILVGGAAVEFYTGGVVTSGDFDFVTEAQAAFEAALIALGFRREDRAGHLLRGLYHPELDMGVEVVSGQLFDGLSDRSRLVLVDVRGHELRLPPVEDLIADRMGQFNSSPAGVPAMLDQAAKLYLLASEIDEAYLDRRIRDETAGHYGLDFLKDHAHGLASDHP